MVAAEKRCWALGANLFGTREDYHCTSTAVLVASIERHIDLGLARLALVLVWPLKRHNQLGQYVFLGGYNGRN